MNLTRINELTSADVHLISQRTALADEHKSQVFTTEYRLCQGIREREQEVVSYVTGDKRGTDSVF